MVRKIVQGEEVGYKAEEEGGVSTEGSKGRRVGVPWNK